MIVVCVVLYSPGSLFFAKSIYVYAYTHVEYHRVSSYSIDRYIIEIHRKKKERLYWSKAGRHTREPNIKWAKYQNSKSSSYKLFLIGTFFRWGNRLLSLIFFLRRASLIKIQRSTGCSLNRIPFIRPSKWSSNAKSLSKFADEASLCWKSGSVRVSMLCFTMFIVYFIFEKNKI